jgi:hypothetical protein
MRHIHLKYEEGIDTRKALEVAAESIVDGRFSGEGVEIGEDVLVKKDMGAYETLMPQDISPDRGMLEVDLRGRGAIGIEVRRKESGC